MTARRGVTFRRVQLGAELRRLRESRTGLSAERIAKELRISQSKLSNVERGTIPLPRIGDLERLLDRYEVIDPDDRDLLITMHKESLSKEPWHHYRTVMPSGMSLFVGLERDAREIKDWVQIVVPGLLQTEEYARSLMLSAKIVDERTTEFVESGVSIRMERKKAITRSESPVHLRSVISESALRRVVGGPEVMRRQFEEIERLCGIETVSVQILPLALPTYRSHDNFSVLEFGDGLPPVAITEHSKGVTFWDRENELWAFARRFDKMRESALAPEETPRFLQKLAREIF